MKEFITDLLTKVNNNKKNILNKNNLISVSNTISADTHISDVVLTPKMRDDTSLDINQFDFITSYDSSTKEITIKNGLYLTRKIVSIGSTLLSTSPSTVSFMIGIKHGNEYEQIVSENRKGICSNSDFFLVDDTNHTFTINITASNTDSSNSIKISATYEFYPLYYF